MSNTKEQDEFLSLAEPMHLPLTDLECSFIAHLFLYDALVHGEAVEYNGELIRKTPQGEEVIGAILKTLLAIASGDEQMIRKMDDYIRLESIIRENKTTLTANVQGDEEFLTESIIRDKNITLTGKGD